MAEEPRLKGGRCRIYDEGEGSIARDPQRERASRSIPWRRLSAGGPRVIPVTLRYGRRRSALGAAPTSVQAPRPRFTPAAITTPLIRRPRSLPAAATALIATDTFPSAAGKDGASTSSSLPPISEQRSPGFLLIDRPLAADCLREEVVAHLPIPNANDLKNRCVQVKE